MSPPELLEHPLAEAVTLALAHFLWQGAAIAAALVSIVKLLGIRRQQNRYLCSLAALVLMAACPAVTLAVVSCRGQGPVPSSQETAARGQETRDHSPLTTHHSPHSAIRNPHSAIASAQPYVLAAWLAGVAFFGCRLLLGVIGVQQIRRQRLPLPRELAERVQQLGRRLGMRARSTVFLSRRAGQAMAVGVVKPLVLIPAAWATEMPLVMLEAVIAHELAHLARRDLWIVMLERVVQTLLFYHPAVWWLSSRLRAERELCCDELAVALTGRRLEYVQALESAARWGARVEPLLAASIRGERNMQLLKRVRNVLGMSAEGESSRLWPAGLVVLLLPVLAWGWSAGIVTPQPSVAVADDDLEDRDDDDDADEKEARRGGERDDDDDEDDDDEKGDRKGKEGDSQQGQQGQQRQQGQQGQQRQQGQQGQQDDDADEKEVRKDGDKPEVKVIRKDGEESAAAIRKRERIEQLKFLNKDGEFKRDGVKKEAPKDGEIRKEGVKDPPRKVLKDGARRQFEIEIKGEGYDRVAELLATIKKLTAENDRLQAENFKLRGGKKENVGSENEAAAREKEAFYRKAGAEKEAAVREKEAFLERVIAEKEAAVARERKIKSESARNDAELRARRIKEVRARAAALEEQARAAVREAEAVERAAREKQDDRQ